MSAPTEQPAIDAPANPWSTAAFVPKFRSAPSHLSQVLDPKALRECVRIAGLKIAPLKPDALLATGLSGCLFASALGFVMGIPVVVVRKPEHPRPHSQNLVEGPDTIRNYVFVDDLIDSGATLERAIMHARERYKGSECIGVYCYHCTPGRYSLPIGMDSLRIIQ